MNRNRKINEGGIHCKGRDFAQSMEDFIKKYQEDFPQSKKDCEKECQAQGKKCVCKDGKCTCENKQPKYLRLTENELHALIKESVQAILEDRFDRNFKAWDVANNASKERQDAYNKRQNDPYAWGKRVRRFRNGSTKAFNDEYGYNVEADWDGNIIPKDDSKPFYGGGHIYGRSGDEFISGRGKGIGDDSKIYNRQSLGTTRPYTTPRGEKRGNWGQEIDNSDDVNTSMSTHIPSKMAQMRGDAAIRRQFKK